VKKTISLPKKIYKAPGLKQRKIKIFTKIRGFDSIENGLLLAAEDVGDRP
jgi:hypothetical protein